MVDDDSVPQLVCSAPQLSSNLINVSSKESKNDHHDNVIKTNNMHTEKNVTGFNSVFYLPFLF